MLAFVLGFVLAAATPSPVPAASPATIPGVSPATSPGATLTAGKIFANARVAMYLRSYPRFVTYIIDIQATAYGKHYHEGYRAMLRTHDGALAVKRTPLYSTNQPVNPYGFSFFGLNKEGSPEDHIEPPFGVPIISAVYDFGLARPPPLRRGAEASPGPDEFAPPVLGRISVSGADYDVTLLGEETEDGHDVYHLSLTPLDDPNRNRVRELWVDTHTFDVWKLVTHGIFIGGPPADVDWTVTFIQLQGHWFIRQETTTATLATNGHLFGGATRYEGINYTLGAYSYPGLISDLEFIETQFETDAVQQ